MFIKNNVIKSRMDIVIIKNGTQIFNPSDELLYEDGWIKYEETVADENLLDKTISNKIHEINWYDSSNNVNSCIIYYMGQEMLYWADKTERSSLKTAVEDCLKVGRESYRLDIRELNLSLQITCEQLLNMLSQLEVYAIDCYNKTTDHIFAVQNLDSVEAVMNYNFKEGYPKKLRFEF